jgi:hypothetical protein
LTTIQIIIADTSRFSTTFTKELLHLSWHENATEGEFHPHAFIGKRTSTLYYSPITPTSFRLERSSRLGLSTHIKPRSAIKALGRGSSVHNGSKSVFKGSERQGIFELPSYVLFFFFLKFALVSCPS